MKKYGVFSRISIYCNRVTVDMPQQSNQCHKNVLQLISVHAKNNTCIELFYSKSLFSGHTSESACHETFTSLSTICMSIDAILAGITWHSAVTSLICQLFTHLVLFWSEQSYLSLALWPVLTQHQANCFRKFAHTTNKVHFNIWQPLTGYILQSFSRKNVVNLPICYVQ